MNPGDRLGEFGIVRELGRGGMGTVYLARDERLDRRIALKVIAPQLARDPEFQRRFESEARSAAAIDDPHAVPVYSAGSIDGRLYIAMRFIDGTDLRALLAERGALDPSEAAAIVADVASALDAAHAAGFVHRDVKPANILIGESRGRRAAFLTDFGLTKGLHAESTQLTGTGQWIGTLDYVAPEQMTDGKVDARTDVYALGCVAHEMLSGSVPFPGTDVQKMWKHVNEPLPPLAGGEALGRVVIQATAKDPDERFQSAGDLARSLAAAVEGKPNPAATGNVATGAAAAGFPEGPGGTERTRTMKSPPPSPRERPTTAMTMPADRARRGNGRRRSSSALIAALGGSLVLAIGLIGAALILTNGNDRSPSPLAARTTASARQPNDRIETEQIQSPATANRTEAEAAGSSSETVLYTETLYSISIPSEWGQETSDEPSGNPPGSYLESVWRSPSEPNTSITVDSQTPAPEASPLESAVEVRSGTSQSDGYREIAFEQTSLAGLPAARWVFQVEGDDGIVDRRVDYFVNLCGAGVALLGSTTPALFGAFESTFHSAAESLTTICGE